MRGVNEVGLFGRGVVAADHELASQAGAGVLKAGGNAVDAAVATSLALSVVRPYSCGIGGGGFMIVRLADRGEGEIITAIDYRETAPAGVGSDYYTVRSRSSTRGGTAVAVPGTVAGLVYAHERYGKLPLASVVQPAIDLAERGFAVDAHYAAMSADLISRFEEHPEWKQRFAFVWQRMLRGGEVRVGDVIVAPEQAVVLNLIARQGRGGFYEGEVARQIVHAVRKDGGDLTLEDLRDYQPRELEPVRAQAFGRTFVGMPPPSSGGVTMLEALRIMEAAGYDAGGVCDDATDAHIMVEALKHAFADRARWFGDPAFVDVPVQALLSDENVRARAGAIDLTRTQAPQVYGSNPAMVEDHGTSHLSVVDAEGNAVACTETINLEFGSLLSIDAYGFVLNNEMDDFLSVPGEPNTFGLMQSERNLPAPGKRPLSSMSPTMVFDEQGLLLVAGGSGGPRIITGTMQVILNALAGDSAGEALSRPRIHHQWMPDRLDLEPGALAEGDVRGKLESMGHALGERAAIGNVQMILRRGQGWEAASDPRKGGKPAGY
ncbi:MAG: gamma-glutamyltransferase [Leptolyngbya sp. PLA3]|nr:MAG: gamma-glutamyltransferase [Cyanobacteria bacterium CYA]MCE7967285.1 gamma-glutamyltransferase [Leptolyngbya sp. PL-A3]